MSVTYLAPTFPFCFFSELRAANWGRTAENEVRADIAISWLRFERGDSQNNLARCSAGSPERRRSANYPASLLLWPPTELTNSQVNECPQEFEFPLGLVEHITVGILHCRSHASCPCVDEDDRTRGSFEGQELVATQQTSVCMAQRQTFSPRNLFLPAQKENSFYRIYLRGLSSFSPGVLDGVAWCGHPRGW